MVPVKKIFYLTGVFVLAMLTEVSAQSGLDSIQLKTVKSKMVSYGSLTAKAPIVLVCFWSVNSDVSIQEVNAINVQYGKWKQPAPFVLLAICIDEGNLLNRMRPTASQNDWAFDVYADFNGDLQKSLHFTNPPQAFILEKGQVVYQQSGFEPGTEDYLFSRIRSLANPPLPR